MWVDPPQRWVLASWTARTSGEASRTVFTRAPRRFDHDHFAFMRVVFITL